MREFQTNANSGVHGFPNIRTIQRSLADLHRRYPGPALLGLQFSSLLSPAIVDAATCGDPIDSAKRVMRAILHHFYLPTASTELRFSDSLEVPARISTIRRGTRLIEMQSCYMGRRETVAILAHEIAHYFLDELELRYENTLENEILTDTTANYLGVGWSVLNAYSETVTRAERWVGINTKETTTTTHFSKMGYLTPEEFGYVLARRCYITDENILPWIERREGKKALSAGSAHFRRELSQPPLVTASPIRRLRYKYAVWRSRWGSRSEADSDWHGDFVIETVGNKGVLFRCPRCTQPLRLPLGIKKARVTCTACRDAFTCSS